MRLRRFGIPAIAVATIVFVGVATAGVLAVRATAAPNTAAADAATPAAVVGLAADPTSAPTTSPAASPAAASITAPAAESSPDAASAPATDATPTPTEPPIELSALPAKSGPDSLPDKQRPVTGAMNAEAAESSKGTIYTWHDGKSERRVVLQAELVVQHTANVSVEDDVVATAGSGSIVRRQAKHRPDALPAFRSATSGALMTLPGGVLLVLAPAWDQAHVNDFFSRNNIAPNRISALGPLPNGFQIETQPGLPSLELANALAGQEGVVLSSPNWWRETQAK